MCVSNRLYCVERSFGPFFRKIMTWASFYTFLNNDSGFYSLSFILRSRVVFCSKRVLYFAPLWVRNKYVLVSWAGVCVV